MGYTLKRLVNDVETICDRRIGTLDGGIYMRIRGSETLVSDNGEVVTNILVSYHEDKAMRDEDIRKNVRPAFKQETKVVVETQDDVQYPEYQISLTDARAMQGYEAAEVEDVVTIPEEERPIIKLPTTITLVKDAQSRDAVYADTDFRNQFINLGISITDVDPD